MANTMKYYKKMDTVACRICGKMIKYNEPRLQTYVTGFRTCVSIAVHIHHLSDEEKEKIMVEEI